MLPIIESESVCINLWKERLIPATRRILLVSTDLQARVRLEAAVGRLDVELISRSPDAGMPPEQPDVIVLDLDALGADGAARWAGLAPGDARLLGFFSHIDEDLGDEAQRLGVETHRRGRFWRAAGDIVTRALERGD